LILETISFSHFEQQQIRSLALWSHNKPHNRIKIFTKHRHSSLARSIAFIAPSPRAYRPQRIELTVQAEDVIIDNVALFELNGFRFRIDRDAPPQVRTETPFFVFPVAFLFW
jgi:hypothetical protein